MINPYLDFIKANQELWSRIHSSKSYTGLLLVEPQSNPIISHSNAVFARIIKEAKALRLGWIGVGDVAVHERLLSYDPTSSVITMKRLSLFRVLSIGLQFVYSSAKMLLTGDILNFSLGGVRFGDILYDTCLVNYQIATIPKVGVKVLSTLLRVITTHYRYKAIIQDSGATAVLVSHDVGLSSGVLMRTALQLGICVYHQRGGVISATLNLYKSMSDLYQYAYKPRSSDLQLLAQIDKSKLDKDFQDIMEGRIEIQPDMDTERAYQKCKKVYHSNIEFANKYCLPVDQKLVFVMLHAFNDHPHSHFGKMLFKDYYDWFEQTLAFAKTKSDVNWIFKEHPSAAMYPTRDLSLPNHFEDCPSHIIFLDADASFNSKSLFYIANSVVTVVGTAGIEFAASAKVPSILAGTAEYSGFGFSVEPETVDEYFHVLSEIQNIEKLTEHQQDTARMVFLYAELYSKVPYSWSPMVSLEAERDADLDRYYWAGVSERYAEKADELLEEFEKYVRYVGREDFSRLAGLEFSVWGDALKGAKFDPMIGS